MTPEGWVVQPSVIVTAEVHGSRYPFRIETDAEVFPGDKIRIPSGDIAEVLRVGSDFLGLIPLAELVN